MEDGGVWVTGAGSLVCGCAGSVRAVGFVDGGWWPAVCKVRLVRVERKRRT